MDKRENMTIPESQLTTWQNQGAATTAEATDRSIRNALSNYVWPEGVSYEMYLQGSYRNATNIRGDSDVDLVTELTSVFYCNLSQEEKARLGLSSASHTWAMFRTAVIEALTKYYGTRLIDTSGDKSVKVLPDQGRLKCDVVVAAMYKYYENLSLRATGMTFWTQKGNHQIVNYPKLHFERGAAKNADTRTSGRYKPSIRMFKNARGRVYDNDERLQGRFPSYFLECLLFNVPDAKFQVYAKDTYVDAVNWLNETLSSMTADELVSQSGMTYLFGAASTQWNKADAQLLVSKLIELWSNW